MCWYFFWKNNLRERATGQLWLRPSTWLERAKADVKLVGRHADTDPVNAGGALDVTAMMPAAIRFPQAPARIGSV
jgi:hypothetical protein